MLCGYGRAAWPPLFVFLQKVYPPKADISRGQVDLILFIVSEQMENGSG